MGHWIVRAPSDELFAARARIVPGYNERLNTMRRLRSRKSIVLFGLAVVVFAACFPSLSFKLPTAILTPLWIVPQALSIVVVRRTATRCDDQPVALLSLSLFRAPPSLLAVA